MTTTLPASEVPNTSLSTAADTSPETRDEDASPGSGPQWLRPKRNEHVCVPRAVLDALQADPMVSVHYHMSGVFEIDDLAIGGRDALLRAYILGRKEPDAFLDVARPHYGSQGRPGGWDIAKQFYEGSGATNLHLAVRLGDPVCVYESIRLGADVNHQDGRGQTPLFCAVEEITGHLLDMARAGRLEATDDYIPRSAKYRLRLIIKTLLEQHAEVWWKAPAFGLALVPSTATVPVAPVALAWLSLDLELLELFALHGAFAALSHRSFDRMALAGTPCWDRYPDRVAALKELFLRTIAHPPTRPPRKCPCLSGKPLAECHALRARPYPSSFPCVCGISKTYGRCCKRRGLGFVEGWDEDRQRMVVACRVVDDQGQTVSYQHPAAVSQLLFDSSASTEGLRKLREDILELAIQVEQNDAAYESEKADPAFRYAAAQNKFLPMLVDSPARTLVN